MESLREPAQLGSADEIVTTVLAAVAESEGCDPLDLPPIYERLDPEALAALPREAGFVELSFRYYGHQVTIGRDGGVSATPRQN